MSYTLAVAGKGGTGKTTIAGLIITRLIAAGRSPVLAVDADPNSCLDGALGVTVTETVGALREHARKLAGKGLGAGISKQELLELRIAESLVEADSFDLIAMGRSEGPGCYCYANSVLRQVIAQIADSYPLVVIDNEAGLENLSRRIVRRVDLLVMVTDPSQAGLRTVERLFDLASEIELDFEQLAIVVNRLPRGEFTSGAQALDNKIQPDHTLALPEDPVLSALGERGDSLFTIADDHPAVSRLDHWLRQIGMGASHDDKKTN